jgi:hypothetical protein
MSTSAEAAEVQPQQAFIENDTRTRSVQHSRDDEDGGHTFRTPTTIPLDPADYLSWAVLMRALLEMGGMWHLVQPLSQPDLSGAAHSSSASSSSNSAVTHPSAKSKEAFFILASALKGSSDTMRILIGLPSQDPRALWAALQQRYTQMPKAAVAALYSQLLTLKQAANEGVRAFADRIRLLRHQLSAAGRHVSDEEILTAFVNGVHSSLAMQVSMFYNVTPNSPLEHLVTVALGEETRLQLTGQAGNKAGSIGNANALGASQSSTRKCHACASPDHIASACPKRQNRTATPQEVATGACPRPGHKHHKAADCRQGAAATDSKPAATGVPRSSTIVSLGSAVVSTVALHTLANSSSAVVLDSGAGRTVIPSSGTLLNGSAASDVQITVANGQILASPMRGTAVIAAAGSLQLHVKNALQHAQIDRPLLSVGSVVTDDAKVREIVFRKEGAAAFTPTGEILFTASLRDGVYILNTDAETCRQVAQFFLPRSGSVTIAAATTEIAVTADAELLHQRCCHRSYDGMRALVDSKAVIGIGEVKLPSAGLDSSHRCDGCSKGKAHRRPFGDHLTAGTIARHTLARIHADVAGPIPVESLGGSHYFLVLLDEWSQHGFVVPLKQKSDAAEKIIDFCREARTRHGRHVVEFHSDGGGEFVNEKLAQFFRKNGTTQTTTVAHTPQHNGKAERLIRTLAEWTNATLTHAGAAKLFWAHAVDTVMYARNRTQVCQKENAEKTDLGATPHHRWFELSSPSSIEHLRVFGCDADVHYTVSPGLKLKKFESKSRLCMFVGYDAKKGDAWRFYDPTKGVVFTSRDAKFYEDRFTISHAVREKQLDTADGQESEDDEDWLSRTTFDNEIKLAQIISREAAAAESPSPISDSDDSGEENDSDHAGEAPEVDSEDAANVDVPSVSNSSAPPTQGASTSVAPTAEAPRRSTRDRQQTHFYGKVNGNLAQARSIFAGLAVALAEEAADAEVPNLGVPRTFAEAWADPAWRTAVIRELAAHATNGTWEFVQLPPGAKAIGNRYVFAVKLNPDGTEERKKVRLTAQGFAQREGIDYNETYAPVLNYHTLRAILALAAAGDWEIHQIDVETAFLNATVEEDLYMRVPDGVEAPPGTVCKLRKALYGIKQAPHAWHADIAATLIDTMGYRPSTQDPCLFLKRSRTDRMILFPLFVDDSFPTCHTTDLAEMLEDKAILMRRYKIKDTGDAKSLLGMRITRDRSLRIIYLDQSAYIARLLADYGATSARPKHTPQRLDESKQNDDTTEAAPTLEQRQAYYALVGSLLYLALSTRPDICGAVNNLARSLTNPTAKARSDAWHLLCYLVATADLRLTYSGDATKRALIGYSDANWAGRGGDNDGKSTSGWIVKLGSGPISWSSKKQNMVALSTTESEYVAVSLAAQEIIWLRYLLIECGVTGNAATKLYCDNTAAIALSENSKISQRTKHINVRYHFIRDCVKAGTIEVKWVSTQRQPADLLTKPLGPHIFLRLRPTIMGTEYETHGVYSLDAPTLMLH